MEISLPIVRNGGHNMKVTLERVFVSCTGPLINAIEDVVFGVHYNFTHFACMRLGDYEWTNIEVDLFPSKSRACIHDIIFYKGKIVFVDQFGTVFVYEENVRVPHGRNHLYRCPVEAMKFIDHTYRRHMSFWQKVVSNNAITPSFGDYEYYLVENEEELILVIKFNHWRNMYSNRYRDEFRIFKLDFSRRKLVFMNKGDMEGCSLFLNSRYRCVAAKIVSRNSCIYFKIRETTLSTSKSQNGDNDSDGAVLSEVTELHPYYTHPVWIIPRCTNVLEQRASCFNFLFH